MAETSISFGNAWLSHPDTLWIEHTDLVEKYAIEFAESLPKSTEQLLPRYIFIGMCRWIALFHDLGKTTAYFQEYIRSEDHLKNEMTHHALLSALITYWVTERWLNKKSLVMVDTELLAFIAFMVVRYHHGNLDNPFRAYRIYHEQVEILQKQWESIDRKQLNDFWNKKEIPLTIEQIEKLIRNLPSSFHPQRRIVRFFRKRSDFNYYYLTNTLFSILLDADKSAAGLQEIPSQTTHLSTDLIDQYRHLKGWDRTKSEFDGLRNKTYSESIDKIEKGMYGRILSLQLPTGFGKTLTAISVALKLMDKEKLDRIIYSLPFTAIIDQNYEAINGVLQTTLNQEINSTILLKHHHLSDVFFSTNDQEYGPLESQLLIEGWNSKIIVTTFVQLFHTLIGFRNRTLRKFHRLSNSVIILDEIQAIPFKFWNLLNRIIQDFADIFNSYFIFVTATEPRFFSSEQQTELVDYKPYFEAINRVQMYIDFERGLYLEEYREFVLEKIIDRKRVIVVFNTINSAKQFHEKMRNDVKNLFYLSSHIIPKQRLAIIKKLNDEKEYFLITTQLIEAGVNLDAEIVFRDLGPLDSINQVAGRCNRFAKQDKGEVYIVRLLDDKNQRSFASYIYDRALIDLTQRTLTKKSISENLFLQYCDKYFDQISQFPQNESHQLIDSVANLKYDNDDFAISNFRLIEQNYEKYDVFIELDSEAQNIWRRYLALKEIKDFWKWRDAYLRIKNKFQNYLISVGEKDIRNNPPPFLEGIYFVGKNQLDEYYDIITGYKKVSNTSIW